MSSQADQQRLNSRKYGLTAIVLTAALAGSAWGGWYFLYGHHHVTTDDAYVNGDIIQITSEISGRIRTVRVDDTQTVYAGQILLELDPADAELGVEATREDLAKVVRQVSQQYARVETLRSLVLERKAAIDRASGDLERRLSAGDSRSISVEEVAHARYSLTEARAALETAKAQLTEAQSMTRGIDVQHHPEVLAAESRVRDAILTLHRTRITAPTDGVIVQRHVQPGQHVAPGTPLMAVIPLETVWVDANFKEVQLRDVRTGQPASIRTDFYKASVVFHGRVAGFAPGTGAAFALMPPQNATGNWIKIVQRLPVRIALNPAELERNPLRIGLSASVEIDLRGPIAPVALRSASPPAVSSALHSSTTEQTIDQIVKTNIGTSRTGTGE